MLIAHLSDCHIGMDALSNGCHIDAAHGFNRAIRHILALVPRPDLVVMTGDLCDQGHAGDYHVIAEGIAALSACAIPAYAIIGNHDIEGNARPVLGAALPANVAAGDNHCSYQRQVGPLHLIALDTVVPNQDHGALDRTRLAWLKTALDALARQPVLLIMHHPPVVTGIAPMDACGLLEGGSELADLIAGHGDVVGILCGHVHRSISADFAGAPVRIAPSTAYQVELNLRPESPLRGILEPPAIALHCWSAQNGLVSHVSYVGEFMAA